MKGKIKIKHGMKVKISRMINDLWLEETFNDHTKKSKAEYNGAIGVIVNYPRRSKLTEAALYDVRFIDGAVWCFEYSELEVIR